MDGSVVGHYIIPPGWLVLWDYGGHWVPVMSDDFGSGRPRVFRTRDAALSRSLEIRKRTKIRRSERFNPKRSM